MMTEGGKNIFDELPTDTVLPAVRRACIVGENVLVMRAPSIVERTKKRVFVFYDPENSIFAPLDIGNKIDAEAANAELLRPSSVLFWMEYLGAVSISNPDLITRLGDNRRRPSDQADDLLSPQEIAMKLSLGNANFIEEGMQGQGLAALFGNNLQKYVTRFGQTRGSYPAASKTAAQFPTSARNGAALHERLTMLYPTEGSISRPGTALHNLVEGGAFTLRGRECPAKRLTVAIFEAYGKVLAEPRYKELFLRRVEQSYPEFMFV